MALLFSLQLKSGLLPKSIQDLSTSHSSLASPAHHLPGSVHSPRPWSLPPVFAPQSVPPLKQTEGACEHLSQVTSLYCAEPSKVPSSLRAKAKVLTMGHRAPCPVTSHSAPHSLCSSYNASSLFSKHSRYGPAPGPLHRLFPLPRSPMDPLSPPSSLSSNVASSGRPPLTNPSKIPTPGLIFLISLP